MKNVSKKIRAIIWVAVVGVLLTAMSSCGEKETGGTIVVTTYFNLYPIYNFTVCLTDAGYNKVSGNMSVPFGEPVEFVVKDDGSYWVCTVSSSNNVSPQKKVSVSGGETVNVTLDLR
jgi:hypothetical protein